MTTTTTVAGMVRIYDDIFLVASFTFLPTMNAAQFRQQPRGCVYALFTYLLIIFVVCIIC